MVTGSAPLVSAWHQRCEPRLSLGWSWRMIWGKEKRTRISFHSQESCNRMQTEWFRTDLKSLVFRDLGVKYHHNHDAKVMTRTGKVVCNWPESKRNEVEKSNYLQANCFAADRPASLRICPRKEKGNISQLFWVSVDYNSKSFWVQNVLRCKIMHSKGVQSSLKSLIISKLERISDFPIRSDTHLSADLDGSLRRPCGSHKAAKRSAAPAMRWICGKEQFKIKIEFTECNGLQKSNSKASEDNTRFLIIIRSYEVSGFSHHSLAEDERRGIAELPACDRPEDCAKEAICALPNPKRLRSPDQCMSENGKHEIS